MRTTSPERDALHRELERSIAHVLELSRGQRPLSGKTVHEIRRVLKRVRAALRLVRDAIGKDEYARQNALLRNAGRALRAARDAASTAPRPAMNLRRFTRSPDPPAAAGAGS